MNTILLHKDIYFPEWINASVNVVLTQYKKYVLSKHVKDRAIVNDDRSHGYTLEKLTNALNNALGKTFEPFEVEIMRPHKYARWIVSKVCIRIPYSNTEEICVSIRTNKDRETNMYDKSTAFIVTAWLNNVNDSHRTLDMSNYVNENQFKQLV